LHGRKKGSRGGAPGVFIGGLFHGEGARVQVGGRDRWRRELPCGKRRGAGGGR
jgi:hypothetical protein